MARSTSQTPAAGLPATLGELRASGWQPRTVKEELRANLVARLAAGRPSFPGIVGFDETVIPAIENAILAGQDIVFLGERGQAKTRLARLLVDLLDDWLPGRPRRRAQRRPVRPDQRRRAGRSSPRAATRRRSTGSRATGATPRSSRRRTSRSRT